MSTDELFSIIHDAVTAQAQGRLTPEGARRLEDVVLSSPEARRLYVQYVRETASLRWWATAHGDEVQLGGEDEAGACEAPSLNESMVLPSVRDTAEAKDALLVLPPVPPAPVPASPRFRIVPWGIAATLFLALGVSVIALWPGDRDVLVEAPASRPALVLRPPATRPVVGVLAAAVDAEWVTEEFAPKPGSALTAGPRELRAGAARITLGRGAEVIVRGPARFDLQSPTEALLLEGQMTARVDGKVAAGFTVHTPSATVVDLGTEFGLRVGADGATETQVVRGTVELKPAKGHSANPLHAGTAVLVDAAGTTATPVAYRPADFAHRMTAIDLADVVAGGDGTQDRREAGINMLTGALVTVPPEFKQIEAKSDGQFHPCPGLPFIAGVFMPRGAAPETLDPAGHTFSFPKTDGNTWYWLWAGGRIPIKDDPKGLTAFPTKIGEIDYNVRGHGVILMRTNKGVTFDLAALRAAHPGRTFTRFRATGVNTALSTPTPDRPVSEKSEFRAFVDGQLRFERSPILLSDGPFEIAVELPPGARYLTLAATDGEDSYHLDWVTLGDPRLE